MSRSSRPSLSHRLASTPCAAYRRRPSPPEVHRQGCHTPALPPLPSFRFSLSPPHLRSSFSVEPQQALEELGRRCRPSDPPEPPVVDPIWLPSARSTPAPPEPCIELPPPLVDRIARLKSGKKEVQFVPSVRACTGCTASLRQQGRERDDRDKFDGGRRRPWSWKRGCVRRVGGVRPNS